MRDKYEVNIYNSHRDLVKLINQQRSEIKLSNERIDELERMLIGIKTSTNEETELIIDGVAFIVKRKNEDKNND